MVRSYHSKCNQATHPGKRREDRRGNCSIEFHQPVIQVDGRKLKCMNRQGRLLISSVQVIREFVVPRIDDSLDALSRSKFFSMLDLNSGYWQVP